MARGPALILGTILLAAGLYFLYKQHRFPPFSNFPDGNAPVNGKVLGVFGANGWTGMLTAVGGGLLLFGAAQHLLAKTMSLIVGAALGAAAVIAVVNGNVLGMAAANNWTKLGWGIAAAILLLNTLMPRRRREVVVPAGEAGYDNGRRDAGYDNGRSDAGYENGARDDGTDAASSRTAVHRPTSSEERSAAQGPMAAEERTAVQQPAAADERTGVQQPAATDQRPAVEQPAAGEEPLVRPLSNEERAPR